MQPTRSFTLVLIAIIGVALIATGYGVAQLTSVETEVRVVARPHEDGRVGFAVQQRVDGEWGERIAPSSRYLTPALIESRAGRWLNSSPITLTVSIDDTEMTTSSSGANDGEDPGVSAPTGSSYEPTIADNLGTYDPRSAFLLYVAQKDAFSDGVRTDVRMMGPNRQLLLDAVCFEDGFAAVGFRIQKVKFDPDDTTEVSVTWRVGEGRVRTENLTIKPIGDLPTVYLQSASTGFDSEWPQLFGGGMLAVRVTYRGVHNEVFDLDRFAQTPVHANLVNCGSY